MKVSVQLHVSAPFLPGKGPAVLIEFPEPVWTSLGEEKNISSLLGVESRILRPVAQSLYRQDPCD